MGVVGGQMQWDAPVAVKKGRALHAFELVLRSAWGLSSPIKQVGRSSIYSMSEKEPIFV